MRAVSEARDILGESPVWSVRDQALYWVDIRAPALHRLSSDGAIRSWPLPDVAGCVVLRASGGLLLGLRTGLFAFDPSDGRLDPLLTVDEGHEENRINDTRCDRSGAVWFGTMWDFGKRRTGSIYRLHPDLRLETVATELTIPNAICFSPSGDKAYFADTPSGAIEVVSILNGHIGPRRTFAAAGIAAGKPDGATIDAEGYVWNARFGAGTLARFAPDGTLDQLVELPTAHPTSCTFGGPDLATLYVTTARQGLDAHALAEQPLAGSVLAFEPGPRGLPEPEFKG